MPAGRTKKPKRSTKGRVCTNEKCDTRLTVYNQAATCYLHSPMKKPRLRGRQVKEEATEMVDTAKRCYACSIRIGGWGQPADEHQDEETGIFHWWVRGRSSKLCEIR